MDAAYSLTKNLLAIKYEDLPVEVVEATKKQVLDIIGVMLGGSSRPGVRELAEVVGEWGGKEESSVFCFGYKVPAPNAAQVNATMGHALDYDDTGDGPTHPSVVIVPTCIAVSECISGINGREIITTVALGTDMMCRLGKAFRSGVKTPPVGGHPGAGWHLTTLYGYLAAAAVAGRLMGLDEKHIVNAMGIAYHQCSGNGQCVNEGSLTKRMGPGFSARGGIMAAFMAEKGITGAENCIEGELGLYNLYHKGEYAPEALTEELGKHFTGVNVTMKPYPCCKGTHDYVDVALRLVNKHGIQPKNVTEITVFTNDEKNFLLYPLEKRSRPENPVDSQFSVPWVVSVVVARGRASVGDFTEEAIRSGDILGVSGKVRVEVDAGLAITGGMVPAKIGITMQNGETYIEQIPASPDSSQTVLPFSKYEKKFRDCAAYSIKQLSDSQIDDMIDKIKHLERLDDIREFVELVR